MEETATTKKKNLLRGILLEQEIEVIRKFWKARDNGVFVEDDLSMRRGRRLIEIHFQVVLVTRDVRKKGGYFEK